MSERQKIVAMAASFIGYKESDGSHRKIIDIYNAHKPLAQNYAVKYTDAWCATFVSAMAIKCGLTDIVPTECSCSRMIQLYKNLGAWCENDAHTPKPGDVIFYDWQDSGIGDNTGAPDHVGIVEKVTGSTITVIEGNKSNAVGRRELKVNGRYIRGYGLPKYRDDDPVVSGSGTASSGTLSFNVGDVVSFSGSTHYTESNGASGRSCKGGKAKVTAVYPTGKHPYHLIAVEGSGATVYGWVDAADVKAIGEISVGDVVQFAGGPHYANANAAGSSATPKAGPAKVTAISKGAKHPYHIIHTSGASSVYGWVDADKVSK